jgi:hypothetical protein
MEINLLLSVIIVGGETIRVPNLALRPVLNTRKYALARIARRSESCDESFHGLQMSQNGNNFWIRP